MDMKPIQLSKTMLEVSWTMFDFGVNEKQKYELRLYEGDYSKMLKTQSVDCSDMTDDSICFGYFLGLEEITYKAALAPKSSKTFISLSHNMGRLKKVNGNKSSLY